MSLDFIHKPNYFLYAQLFIHHLEDHIQKNPESTEAVLNLINIQQLFRQDHASATTNLEGILNIADEYKIDTINGDQKIIQSYKIDTAQNNLIVQLNADAVQSILAGKPFIEPDATIQE